MENRKLNLKDLKLARIRYFDRKMNGAEVTGIDAYAFLYQVGDEYINLFSEEDSYPVFGRVPYTNTTRDGEDFGTKIVQLAGEDESGPCYIIDVDDCSEFFGEDKMDLRTLKEYVMRSDKFFPARYKMLTENASRSSKILNYKKINADRQMLKKFNEYLFSGREIGFYRH